MNLTKYTVFLYVLTQILFYDNLTNIPKIFGGILIAIAILEKFITKTTFRVNWVIFAYFILILHATLGYSINPNLINEVTFPPFFLSFVFLFFFYNSLNNVQNIKYAIFAFCSAVTIICLLSFVPINFFELYENGRYKGTLGNPNFFGYIVNFNVIFLFFIMSRFRISLSNLLFYFLIGLSGLFILRSGSKSNLFLFLMILLIHGGQNVLINKNRGWINLLAIGIFVYVFISILIDQSNFQFLFIEEDNNVMNRLDYISNLINGKKNLEGSDLERLSMVNYGLINWSNEPFFGHGYDSFTASSPFRTYSHNNFVEILYSAGIFGIIIFYSIHISLFSKMKIAMINNNFLDRANLISIFFCFLTMEGSSVYFDNKLIMILIVIFSKNIFNENELESSIKLSSGN